MLYRFRRFFHNIIDAAWYVQQRRSEKKEQYDYGLDILADEIYTKPTEVPDGMRMRVRTRDIVRFWLIGGALLYLSYMTFNSLRLVYLVFTAFIVFLALESIVQWLQYFKLSRSMSVIIAYVMFISILVSWILIVIPFVIQQGVDIIEKVFILTRDIETRISTPEGFISWIEWLAMPGFMKEQVMNVWKDEAMQLAIVNTLEDNLTNIVWFLRPYVSGTGSVLFNFFKSAGNGIAQAMIVTVTAIFLSSEKKQVVRFLWTLSWNPVAMTHRMEKIFMKLGQWFEWQIYLSFIIFFVTRWWLYILQMFWISLENKITLALIAWLMEFIPMIWPWIWWLPAILMAISLYGMKWFIVTTIFYLIIQQTEGNLLIPLVLNKAVWVSPLVVFLSILIGWSTLWFLWVIIAVPTAAIISIIYEDYYRKKFVSKDLEDTA